MRKTKKYPSLLKRYTVQWGPLALAFLLPFLGFVIALMVLGSEPFGNDRAILYSDNFHQYYPFFVAFRTALRNGESLLNNWQIGMGMDFLGLISYYLGSPLNLLSVLVPDSLVLEYYMMLTPIRLGFAGLFFAIMLKRLYGKNDVSIALFGSFYALCAWALAYQWNTMWLDTFAILPLVALGTVSLLRDKKFILYTLALAAANLTNYYIGFFVCIFVLLLFICYEICNFTTLGRFFGDLCRIALFSVLAIGLTAFLELPAVVALGNTNNSVNTFPTSFRLNLVSGADYKYTSKAWKAYQSATVAEDGFFNVAKLLIIALGCSVPPILDGMYQIAGNMGGGILHSFKEGLPNVYSGTTVLLMAFLFLTSGKVKVREKICSVGMLIFFMLSFLIRQLDFIWHGFHFPNMIPYRFSFLFSFVMVWMGYRGWLLRKDYKLGHLIVATVLTLGILLCFPKLDGTVYLIFNGTAVVMTVGMFLYLILERKKTLKLKEELDPQSLRKRKLQSKRRTAVLLSVVMLTELAMNIGCFTHYFPTTSITTYPLGTKDAALAISYMKYREKDNLFYRAEGTHTQTYNDGGLNDFNGITTFSSTANVSVTRFMEALGHGARAGYNRYAFEESSPVATLFLNLKYMIARDGNVQDCSYFDTVHNFGDVYLLENNAYLPLGFLTEEEILDWDTLEGKNCFDRQSNLFRLATGVEDTLWHMSPNGCLSITSDDVEIANADPSTGRTTYSVEGKGTVTYGYTMTKHGYLCVDVDAPSKTLVRFYKKIDGVKTELYYDSMAMSQNFGVCEVQPGDLIWVELRCEDDKNSTMNIQAAILDKEVFQKGYDILAASTLELTDFSNTRAEGTIQCNRDGVLYTSIPTAGFWEAKVDGKPVPVETVGGCMAAIRLTKGEHTVSFRYRNTALITGILVSLCCAMILVAIVLLLHYQRNRSGKYHQPDSGVDSALTAPEPTPEAKEAAPDEPKAAEETE